MAKHSDDRRSFLTGRMVRSKVEQVGNEIADELSNQRIAPISGDTLRLSTKAMACEFSIIFNPGMHDRVMDASAALDLIHELEAQLSVYQPNSEVSRVNDKAISEPYKIRRNLFELIRLSERIFHSTNGFFDLTSGRLIDLWRRCRSEERVPDQLEINHALSAVGMQNIEFDDSNLKIQFRHPDTKIDFGAIGKGYALDRVGQFLKETHIQDYLIHGGHSSLLARGDHNRIGGWPVGIGNPLFTDKRLGTIVLQDCAMSTSGSNIQFYRHQGKRYGHILNPKTGWPVEGALSVTVLAPTSAEADALSTAFYAMGEEQTGKFCNENPNIGAIVIPFPKGGRTVKPSVFNIPENLVFWDESQIQN